MFGEKAALKLRIDELEVQLCIVSDGRMFWAREAGKPCSKCTARDQAELDKLAKRIGKTKSARS